MEKINISLEYDEIITLLNLLDFKRKIVGHLAIHEQYLLEQFEEILEILNEKY